ncbi:MAG: glycosyltransferase family 2 protein [Nitrosotalea sp.]
MSEQVLPIVSIIIINYNGYYYLDRCIESILQSSSPNCEIVVVDNASIDKTVEKIRHKFDGRVKVVALSRNCGPAIARNRGASITTGKYLGFLDNDTVVDPDWAAQAVKKFEEDRSIGVIQCKLVLLGEKSKIDYVGEFLGQNGFLVQVAFAGETDCGQFEEDYEILAAKSAGMFIRKDAFDRIGGFDEDYFMYVEETDLGWRSWLAGYKSVYNHKSIVYHEFGSSSVILGKDVVDYNVKFHGAKNYVLTLYKNLGTQELIKILPMHIMIWIGISFHSLFKKNWKTFLLVHKAMFWNIQNFTRSHSKRSKIQKSRRISDSDLFRKILRRRELSYFLRKVTVDSKVGNAESLWGSYRQRGTSQ